MGEPRCIYCNDRCQQRAMKTITKNLYEFSELLGLQKSGGISGAAVESARQWLREGQFRHDWWDLVYDRWKSALTQIGFIDPEISFSSFGSQGNGASFTCKHVDLEKLTEFLTDYKIAPSEWVGGTGNGEDFRPWIIFKTGVHWRLAAGPNGRIPEDAMAAIERLSSHYSHEHTCRFTINWDEDAEVLLNGMYDVMASLAHSAECLRVELCRAIYRDLQEESDYLESDENLIEMSAANKYTFDDTGHRED